MLHSYTHALLSQVARLAILLALLAPLHTHAFWIISHHELVSQRLDPIVSPNGLSSHTHTFVGSSAIVPGSNPNTSCTTSPVKADRSKYWAPQLYYYHAKSQTFSSVPLFFTNTYYLNRNDSKTDLKAFPFGLKMIAGNASLYDGPAKETSKAKAVSYVCLGVPNSPQTSTLPAGPCPGGIRTQIVFPSCWDGKNLDSKDHVSHVSYPKGSAPDSGDCPSTHPVKFMTLFYEFIYSTGTLKRSASGKSGLVLANGDAVGHSFHADFVAGWDEHVLQAAIEQCTGSLFGDLQKCKPFVDSWKEEKQPASYCTTKSSVDETVLGQNLKYLPGCQPVRNGGFKGAGSGCSNATATSATNAHATGSATSTQAHSTTSAKSTPKIRGPKRVVSSKLSKLRRHAQLAGAQE